MLRGPGGAEVIRYAGLTVVDADGREAGAWLEIRGKDLIVNVEDHDLRFPLVIDPFIQSGKLTASDGAANDQFGISVSVSGDVLVVGAYSDDIGGNNNQGSAYVFEKPSTGWADMTQTAKLTASDGAAGDQFGSSVSVCGDVVVVGAEQNNIGTNNDQGSAYVFVKPATGWTDMTQTAKLTASDGAAGDNFGRLVSVNGDVVGVGAPKDDIGASVDQGSAYVFVKPGTGWADMTQTAKLTASDGAADDRFGRGVSVHGDVVVAGAFNADIGANGNQGAAYVYVKPGTGWADMTQTAKLTASDGAFNDNFGRCVSVSGDTIGVGASAANIGANGNQGAAYVYVKPGTGWGDMTQTAKLTASDGAATDELGRDISVGGDVVVAGANNDKIGANTDQGSAYVFVKPGTGWTDMTQTAKLTASDGAADDMFGVGVSVHGDVVVAGALFNDIGGKNNQGSAYVFPDTEARNTCGLDVATSGQGTGKVTSAPTGISCPGTCEGRFEKNGLVTLTATPDTGSAFDGWSDASCPGNGPCSLTMDQDKAITATFNPDTDSDGISNGIENAGPNDGDGNRDGTLDSQQTNVATFRNVNGDWCTLVSETGTTLEDAGPRSNPSSDDSPDGEHFIEGFFGFRVTGLDPGQAITLTLYLHDRDLDMDAYWKYGPTPGNLQNHWYDFLADGATGANKKTYRTLGTTKLSLSFVDGERGDDDLQANGEIQDVGGPSGSRIVSDQGGSAGCFISCIQ